MHPISWLFLIFVFSPSPLLAYTDPCEDLKGGDKTPKDAFSLCLARARCDYSIKFASTPKEVQELIDRQDMCGHFAGEFNGDGGERDKEVTRETDKLRCSGLDFNTLELLKKYWHKPEITEKILFLYERREEAINKCGKTG